MAPQVAILERVLAMEEQLMYLPEPVLQDSRLGGGRRREGVWVNFSEREIPEREADTGARSSLDALDLTERLPRIGAFVVAVLEDDPTVRPAANVVDPLVEWLDAR